MNKKWFTLVELLVWMALIIILFMWITTVSFKSSSDKQRLEIFWNKIISKIETARSNDLIWRWITQWWVLVNPDSWKIDINSNWQWYIRVFYELSWVFYNFDELFFENWYNITSIVCKRQDWITNTLNNSQIWEIFFEKWKYRIWWNCLANSTELSINIQFSSGESEITFNSINWLLSRD